jgi:hypothetical protein
VSSVMTNYVTRGWVIVSHTNSTEEILYYLQRSSYKIYLYGRMWLYSTTYVVFRNKSFTNTGRVILLKRKKWKMSLLLRYSKS